jgi:hypothetical protein
MVDTQNRGNNGVRDLAARTKKYKRQKTETETISNSIQHAWNNEQLPHQHRPAGNTDSKFCPIHDCLLIIL